MAIGEEDETPPFLPIFMYCSFGVFGAVTVLMAIRYSVSFVYNQRVNYSRLRLIEPPWDWS